MPRQMLYKYMVVVVVYVVSVTSQPTTKLTTQPEPTTTTSGGKPGTPDAVSSVLLADQYTYLTRNTSSNISPEQEGNITEAVIDIHLLEEIHNCTEENQEGVLEVSCDEITSLYIYAKKVNKDKHHLQIQVENVSGPLNLSQIVALNSTLQELDLKYANVTAFLYTKHIHQDFQHLKELNLIGNPDFNASSFMKMGNLPNLHTLNLHGLKLDSKVLSKTFLNATPNLVKLDISNTGLRHLTSEIFSNNPKLKFLDASINDLHVLRLGKGIISNAVRLNVSHCKLESLEIEASGIESSLLEVLDVSHNSLPALPAGLVARLAVDAALDVADNEWECSSCSLYHLWEYLQKRTQVSGGSEIKSCFDLKSLANCGWDECPCGCACSEVTKTVNCTALNKTVIPAVGPSDAQILILNDNHITSMKNINSSSWCNLREIKMDQNRLSNFATRDFRGSCNCDFLPFDSDEENCLPQSLTKISAAYNHIRDFQTNDCVLLQEAKFLNLSHNEIKKIGASNCGFTIMRELDVSYNRIEKMRRKDLASLPYIENLILSNNQLSVLYRYPKNLMPHLKYLDLSHNKIKKIEDRLSSNGSNLNKDWEFDPKKPIKLVELYLHNNLLGNSGGIIQVANISKSLKKLTLHENPWICNCHTNHYTNTLLSAIIEDDNILIDALKSMICQGLETKVINFLQWCFAQSKVPQPKKDSTTPKNIMEESNQTDKNINKESHQTQTDLTRQIVIFVVVGILLVIFMWLCRFYKCVTKTLNGGQTMAELSDETRGRRYDLFVVHSGRDRDFVNEHVIIPLVNKGYQVAWHENMFTPGNYIYENIEKAVRNSRRMLVVATENFTESKWGIKEIRRGRHEEVDVQGYKITALVTNNLPSELKPELYQIVQERTHVVFSDRDYIEKICTFLPRTEPRIISSMNTTISDASLNAFFREFLIHQAAENEENSHPPVWQVFHSGIENGHITINADVEQGTTDESSRATESFTVNKTRFTTLPMTDPLKNSLIDNVSNYRISFRRKLSEASSIVTYPSFICLPPDPKDEEEEVSAPRFRRGKILTISARF